MTRPCRRNACSELATASLSFRYATAQAWLEDLAEAAEPQLWDLCREHAEVLTVPLGWDLVDQRSLPNRSGRPERGGRQAARERRPRRNRYAELSAQLPALAAEMATSSPLTGEGPPAARETGTLPLRAEAARSSGRSDDR